MCGRFLLTAPVDALRRMFALDGPMPNIAPRYNIAPTQPVLVVRKEGEAWRLAHLRWGLVPAWSREGPLTAKPLINARAESVAEKPSFRQAFRRRRCLVPVSGFYEWQAAGKKGAAKVPHLIARPDGAPFVLAGIWEIWSGQDGEEIETLALVTTDANAALTPIHHRMPAVLPEEAWAPWLDTDETEAASLQGWLKPSPEDLLIATPISTRVNSVANDGPELLAPADAPEAAATVARKVPAQGSLF